MTISVKVENGIVTERIKGEQEGYIVESTAQIDWSYDGKTFTPPPWDASLAPSEWHRWIGDKSTRVGEWVEDTLSKTSYERKLSFDDSDASQYKDVLSRYSKAQIEAFINDAFPDPKQNRIVRFLVKDAARRYQE